MSAAGFDADRYTIEQLIRPIANLYKVSTNGQPVAFERSIDRRVAVALGVALDALQSR
jgi:hypothetical protein